MRKYSGYLSAGEIFSIMLDDLDAKILNALQDDARIPLVDLAEKVASSRSAVWRRIQKLEEEGVIEQHTVILNPEKIGLGVMVIAQVKMQTHTRESMPQFIEQVRQFDEVVECHTLMGDIDFFLKIRVKDVQAYEDFFWNKLSPLEGVREISSSIALTNWKNTTKFKVVAT